MEENCNAVFNINFSIFVSLHRHAPDLNLIGKGGMNPSTAGAVPLPLGKGGLYI